MLSARRAGALQLNRRGAPRRRAPAAVGTGGDGGTNAPRQANAAKSVLSLGGGRLCSTVRLFSQCPQYNFAHAPPVLLLAGNVWPINISKPLNVTLFFPDPFYYVGPFFMLGMTGLQFLSLYV